MLVTRRVVSFIGARHALRRLRGAPYSYDAVGVTVDRVPVPDGYSDASSAVVVGHGEEAFRAAGHALVHWDLHRGAGLAVEAESSVVRPGGAVALLAPVGPLAVRAVCRVVEVTGDGRSLGVVLGTLADHPSRGEELLAVRLRDDGAVELSSRAVSRPARWWARGPLAARVRARATAGYARAAAAAVAAPPPVPAAAGGPARGAPALGPGPRR